MKQRCAQFWSSVGKKYVMALTGLGLALFLLTHLAGNLLIIFPQGDAFNSYAEKLEQYGWLLYGAEVGLLGLFLLHAVLAIVITRKNRQARPVSYAATRSKLTVTKGGPSKSGFASARMIVSGIVILAFLVIHLKHLKFGPGETEGYRAVVQGEVMRDLYRLVYEAFSNGWVVGFYILALTLLGFHLRHGIWSLFQSLGLAYPRWSKGLYCFSWFFAVVIAGGFILIPLWVYFNIGSIVYGQ